jgi:PAB-dependent poly(A)-specific ribonuclease subunit 3
MYDGRQDVLVLQQEDLSLFGSLILALGCNNLIAANNPVKALDILSTQYSSELRNLALFLTTKHGPPKVNSTSVFIWIHISSDQNIGHVLSMINSKLPGEIDELLK